MCTHTHTHTLPMYHTPLGILLDTRGGEEVPTPPTLRYGPRKTSTLAATALYTHIHTHIYAPTNTETPSVAILPRKQQNFTLSQR